MSADPDRRRPDGERGPGALAAVPDVPGAYLIRPGDGRAARAIGLAGGTGAVLLAEAGERSHWALPSRSERVVVLPRR